MMTQYPVIPLFYAPARSIYRTDKAVGWPSKDDPYANPQDNPRLWMTHLTAPKLTPAVGRGRTADAPGAAGHGHEEVPR